jgi:hypothetical protein
MGNLRLCERGAGGGGGEGDPPARYRSPPIALGEAGFVLRRGCWDRLTAGYTHDAPP